MYLEQRIASLEELCNQLSEQIMILEARGKDEILTPTEFAKRVKVSQNTVYCWIREGRIKTLDNLGTALRIPMSQFYEEEVSAKQSAVFTDVQKSLPKKKKSLSKADELKREFMESLKG